MADSDERWRIRKGRAYFSSRCEREVSHLFKNKNDFFNLAKGILTFYKKSKLVEVICVSNFYFKRFVNCFN